jgi:hypothetical protein
MPVIPAMPEAAWWHVPAIPDAQESMQSPRRSQAKIQDLIQKITKVRKGMEAWLK